MYVLFALRTPYWVIIYCRHILFGRKVLHKIGSHFRPPLPLRTGVDMGRAFSVFFFALQWTLGITKSIKYLVFVLTPDIWMIMQQAAMALVGSMKHSNLSISSTLQASKFSLTLVTSPNHFLPVPPTSLCWKTTHLSWMAFRRYGKPTQSCPPALTFN